MRSYAAVDRVEGKFAVLEVEKIETTNSNSEDYFDHETEMIEVTLEVIENAVGVLGENDILEVEHDDQGVVLAVYLKAEEEKARREAVYDKIMNG